MVTATAPFRIVSTKPDDSKKEEFTEKQSHFDYSPTIYLLYHQNISWIDVKSLPGEPYTVLQPIRIKIERMGENDFLASFEEANLAMSGETKEEALQNIIAEILDTFEMFSDEASRLGPEPSRQLRVMQKYLKPCHGNFDL